MPRPTEQERFWAKVDQSGEHWLWTGGTTSDGYGVFRVGSQRDGSRRLVYAHRYADEQRHGPLPEGLVVLHGCDIPACVRHTKRGTQLENVEDMVAKGRHWAQRKRRSHGPTGLAALCQAASESPRAMQRLNTVTDARSR